MKYFKCGNCKSPYKIDETKISTTSVTVLCKKCSAKNILRFGPTLVVHTKNGIQQYSLKEGINILGRKTKAATTAIQINDQYVSRKHASIHVEHKEGKIYISIVDEGSMNGTFSSQKVKLKSLLKYPFTKEDYYIIGLSKLSLTI